MSYTNKHDKLKHLAAISSVCVAVFLCIIKGIAFIYTGSLSILSSMVDSLSDIVASVITFFAIKISIKPATTSYRYGYGKAEALSSLFQAGFIAAAGLFILYDSILKIKEPYLIQQTNTGLFVMILSLITTLILVVFQHYVAKKTKSIAILADSAHYKIDVLTNASIIISLIIINIWKIYWIDSLLAGLISIYLMYNAFILGREAIYLLLDKELNETIRTNIIEIVKKHPSKPTLHDLRTHDLGGGYLFEFHLELNGKISLEKAHRYTEEIENLLHQHYPKAQIIIHQEPKGIMDKRLDHILIDN